MAPAEVLWTFERISPDLVLVSPELASRARGALPFGPCETVLLPQAARDELGTGVDTSAATAAARSRRIEWLARIPTALGVLATVIVLGAPGIFVLGPTPTLDAPEAASVTTPVAPAKTLAARHPSTLVAKPPTRTVASGLFYAGSVGRLLVEPGERKVEWFDVDACGVSGRVGPIQITRNATFTFEGAVASERLAISGQFITPQTVRGVVSGPRCARPTRFGARR